MCQAANIEEEGFFSLCVSPIAAKEFLSGTACSSSEPDALQLAASGGGCRLPVPPADRWVGVRRSGSPGAMHSLLPVPAFEGRVSCTLASSTQLERSFLLFVRIIRKRRRESLCGL